MTRAIDRTESAVSFAVRALACALACVVGVAPAAAQQDAPARTLTLADATSLAKRRSPLVTAASSRLASAEAGIDRSRATLLPTVSLQSGATALTAAGRTYSVGVVSADQVERYLLGYGTIGIQWTFADFGRTESAVESARAGAGFERANVQISQQAAIAEAAVAFFALLADRELETGTQEVLRDRERVLAITKRLVENGQRAPLDEQRALISVEVAKLELATVESTSARDSANLAVALRLDPATKFSLISPAPITVDTTELLAAPSHFRHRQEVAAAAARLEQAKRDRDTAHRARRPTLALMANGTVLYSYQEANSTGQPSLSTSGPAGITQASVVATIPLFDPVINANTRVADANVQVAEAELVRVTESVQRDEVVAIRSLHDSGLVLAQSERLAALTQANLATVENRYSVGLETPLALSEAQREDVVARLAVVRARILRNVATVRALVALNRTDELLVAR